MFIHRLWRDTSKFNKWLKFHAGGDLPLKLSVNWTAWNSAPTTKAKETTRNHGYRVEGASCDSLAKTKAVNRTQRNRRLKYHRREILQHRKCRLNLATLINTAKLQNEIPEQWEHRFSYMYTPIYTTLQGLRMTQAHRFRIKWTQRPQTFRQNACLQPIRTGDTDEKCFEKWFC